MAALAQFGGEGCCRDHMPAGPAGGEHEMAHAAHNLLQLTT